MSSETDRIVAALTELRSSDAQRYRRANNRGSFDVVDRRAPSSSEQSSRRTGSAVTAASRRALRTQREERPGGFYGAVAAALDNPVGGAFMAALDVIDTPRAFIASTLQEATDAIQGEGFSWSDLKDQTADNMGFGTYLANEDWLQGDSFGERWGARALGFVGDVALDPTTYVSFGAASAGRSAAAEVAGEAFRRAASTSDNVLRSQLDEIGERAVRGITHLNQNDFDTLNRLRSATEGAAAQQLRGGLQFRAPGSRLGLPGTRNAQGQARSVTILPQRYAGVTPLGAYQRARHAIRGRTVTEGSLWNNVAEAVSGDRAAIRRALRSARNPEQTRTAWLALEATNRGRMAKRQFGHQAVHDYQNVARSLQDAGVDGKLAYRAMGGAADAEEALRAVRVKINGVDSDALTAVRDLSERVRVMANELGGSEEDFIRFREFFQPAKQSEEMRAHIRRTAGTRRGRVSGRRADQSLLPTGSELHATAPGDFYLGHEILSPASSEAVYGRQLTVREQMETIHQAELSGRGYSEIYALFDDDFYNAMPAYLHSLGGRVAMKRTEMELVQRGVAIPSYSTDGAVAGTTAATGARARRSVDEVQRVRARDARATTPAAARKARKAERNARVEAHLAQLHARSFPDRVAALDAEREAVLAAASHSAKSGDLRLARRRAQRIERKVDEAYGSVHRLMADLAEAEDALEGLRIGARTVESRQALIRKVDRLTEEAVTLSSEIDEGMVQALEFRARRDLEAAIEVANNPEASTATREIYEAVARESAAAHQAAVRLRDLNTVLPVEASLQAKIRQGGPVFSEVDNLLAHEGGVDWFAASTVRGEDFGGALGVEFSAAPLSEVSGRLAVRNPLVYEADRFGVLADALYQAHRDGLIDLGTLGRKSERHLWTQVARNADSMGLRAAIADAFHAVDRSDHEVLAELLDGRGLPRRTRRAIADNFRARQLVRGFDGVSFRRPDGSWSVIPFDDNAVELADVAAERRLFDEFGVQEQILNDRDAVEREVVELTERLNVDLAGANGLVDDWEAALGRVRREQANVEALRQRAVEIDGEKEELLRQAEQAWEAAREWDVRYREMTGQWPNTPDMVNVGLVDDAPERTRAVSTALVLHAQAAEAAARKGPGMGAGRYAQAASRVDGEEFVTLVQNGWRRIGWDHQVPAWVGDGIEDMSRMMNPRFWPGLFHAFDVFTNKFKAWAILTPGFHGRNFFGGFVNNYMGGLTDMSMYSTYVRLRRPYRRVLSETGDHHAALEAAVAAARNPLEERAAREVFGSGLLTGGQSSELDYILQGRVSANPFSDRFAPMRASATAAETTENILRGAMAFDSIINRGGTLDDAITRTLRYHFDYDDLSAFERGVMRRVVPFYTWTRKNLPLQIEGLLENPATVQRYMALRRNLENDDPEGRGVEPLWFHSAMSVRTPWTIAGNDVYLYPDVPFRELPRTFSGWQQLQQVNPIIRIPMEIHRGERFFNGAPFRPGWQRVPGPLQPVALVAEKLGFARRNAQGDLVMRDTHIYAIEQLIPVLPRADRLVGEKGEDGMWATAALSYGLGISGTVLTPRAELGELYRRRSGPAEIVDEYEGLGYDQSEYPFTPPPELVRAREQLDEIDMAIEALRAEMGSE